MSSAGILGLRRGRRGSRGGPLTRKYAAGLDSHPDAGSRYTSNRYAERLDEFRALPFIGSIGDSYHNALTETVNG